MKKIFLILAILVSFVLKATAVSIITEPRNIRFSKNRTSQTFTVTTDDDISRLKGESGVIKTKIKYDKKLFSVEPASGVVEIPYTSGVIGNSPAITLTLKNPDAVTKSKQRPFSINPEASFSQKYKLKKLSRKISVDVNGAKVQGRVVIPNVLSSSTSKKKSKKSKLLKYGDNRRTKVLGTFSNDTVPGVTVELIEVDSLGNQVGEVLTSAQTDQNGEFNFELPDDKDFGSNIVVRVPGSETGSGELRCFVSSDEIEVDPISEVIFQNVDEEVVNDINAIYENFTADEIGAIREQVEDLGVAFKDSLDSTIESLETSVGEFIDNMVGVAKDSGTDNNSGSNSESARSKAGGIAGDYFVAFFDVDLSGPVSNGVNNSSASTSASIELGGARLGKPTVAGALQVTAIPILESWARLVRIGDFRPPQNNFEPSPNNNAGPSPDENVGLNPQNEAGVNPEGPGGNFEGPNENFDSSPGRSAYVIETSTRRPTVAGAGVEEFFVSINTDNVITSVEPGEEKIESLPGGEFGFRKDPLVETFYPVGDGMFLSSAFGQGEIFDARTSETFEEKYFFGFGSVVKESSISDADLNGNFGLVGLGIDLGGHGRVGLLGLSGTVNVVNGFATATFSDRELSRESQDGETFTINFTDSPIRGEDGEGAGGTATMTANKGKIVLSVDDIEAGESELFEGYARGDGSIIIFVSSSNRRDSDRDPGRVTSAGREFNVAVRLSGSAPNLSGNTYTILNYGVEFATDGSISMMSSKSGTLSFTNTTATFSDFTLNKATRVGDSGSVSASVVPSLSGSTTATLGANGSIDMTIGGTTLTGFVSADEKLIVLLGYDSSSTMSLYLAVLNE